MNRIVKRMQTSSFAILITSMSLINPAVATYNEPMPTPARPASCEVEIDRLVRASELGSSLSGLNPGMKAHSFKVSDLESSMKVAVGAVNAIPEPKLSDAAAVELNKLTSAVYESRVALNVARDEQDRRRGALQILEEQKIQAPKSIAALKSQIVAAERKLSEFDRAIVESERKLEASKRKHSVYENGPGRFVPTDYLKFQLMDAIEQGPIGRAHHAVNAAKAVIDRSMYRVPFDEVIFVDNSAEAEKARNEFQALSGKMDDVQVLMGKIESIDEILSSNPTLSRTELMAARDTITRQIGKLGTPQEIQTALDARRKIFASRSLVIFKNGGRIVGAVNDTPSLHRTAQGFHCKDGIRHGAWSKHFGFINSDHCYNLRFKGDEFYQDCLFQLRYANERLEGFFFQSEKKVVPTKSPSPQRTTR